MSEAPGQALGAGMARNKGSRGVQPVTHCDRLDFRKFAIYTIVNRGGGVEIPVWRPQLIRKARESLRNRKSSPSSLFLIIARHAGRALIGFK